MTTRDRISIIIDEFVDRDLRIEGCRCSEGGNAEIVVNDYKVVSDSLIELIIEKLQDFYVSTKV